MNIKEESEIFNRAADYYDLFRPSYPIEIINELERHTGIKAGSRLIEIGAGSGKATELFTGKGYDITCIEPGEKLVEIGNSRFKGERIRFEKARFEDYDLPKSSFDCIFAAQSFHWVPQPIGYYKCSYALKKDCYLALIWNMYITYDNSLDNDLVKLSKKYGGLADFLNEQQCEERISSIIIGIQGSGLFENPIVYRHLWVHNYTAEDYYGFALTGNKLLQKSKQEKQQAYDDIKSLADKYNGIIKRPYLCVLYLAKRL